MNIVVFHCHFQRGGVTQVVENHIRAIENDPSIDRILLVSGSRTEGLAQPIRDSVTQIVVDDFDYDSLQPQGPAETILRAAKLTHELTDRLQQEKIDRDQTILHWHNHSLGKNTAAPEVIRRLSDDGWRLLLQIHDFAEDNRPENYLRLVQAQAASAKADIDRYLYPVASQIHYATLTQTDAAVLTKLGVQSDQVHCLPNSVRLAVPPANQAETLERVRNEFSLPPDARWCLYPVRGIRRKNVGEFLLLSQLAPDHYHFAITLCPETPIEKRSYQRWRAVANEAAPRAVFDAANRPCISFIDSLSAADFVVSTSVAEGFGMAMLEPWLAGKGVIARDLPTVTNDFADAGIELPGQYRELPIPGKPRWIARATAEFERAFHAAWSTLPENFRPQFQPPQSSDQVIDFANLIPELQTEVLGRIDTDPGFRLAVNQHCQSVVLRMQTPIDPKQIERNRARVSDQFGAQHQAKQLLSIYQQLLRSAVDRSATAPQNAGFGLDFVSSARPYFPCRTESIA